MTFPLTFSQIYGLRVVQVFPFPGSVDLHALHVLPLRPHPILLVRFHGNPNESKTSLTHQQGLLHRHRRPLLPLMAASSTPHLLRTRHQSPSQHQSSSQRLHLRPHTNNSRLGRRPKLFRPFPVAWNPRPLHPPVHCVLTSGI